LAVERRLGVASVVIERGIESKNLRDKIVQKQLLEVDVDVDVNTEDKSKFPAGDDS
jgi:hypothetical protein